MQVSRIVTFWTWFIAIGLYALFYGRGYDDPYITYHYAANVARGAGFVFNVGERLLSTTTPLYTLVLALAGAVGLNIPLVSTAIGCISLALGGWVFWQLGQHWRTPAAGLIGLLLYPLHPLLTVTISNETALCLTLGLFGLWFTVRGQMGRAAAVLALATLARHDAIMLAGLCALYHMQAHGLHFKFWADKPLMRFCLVYIGILLPWFVFAWGYFGAPMPITLMVKQQQGKMAVSQLFLSGLLDYASYYWTYPTYFLHTVFLLIGLVAAIWRRSPWLWLVAWSALYALGYSLLRVPGYFWYFGPVAPGLVALIGVGVEAAVSAKSQEPRFKIQDSRAKNKEPSTKHSSPNTVLLAVLAGLMWLPQVRSTVQLRDFNDNRLGLYQKTGEWLNANTPPNASIGTLEVGIIGYYAQRRLVDFAGLLQPDVARQMQHDSTYDDLALWAWERYQPNYLAMFEGGFQPIRQSQRFKSLCREAANISDPAHPAKMQIYRCLP